MRTESVSFSPQFTARCNFRGDISVLNIYQLRKVIMECRTIGTMRDQIDIFIPKDCKKQKYGVIPMAGLVKGDLRAFIGKYRDGQVYDGLLNGIAYAKTALYPGHVHE